MYFTDCTLNNASCDKGKVDGGRGKGVTGTTRPGILDMLLPGKTEYLNFMIECAYNYVEWLLYSVENYYRMCLIYVSDCL